jgi:hypothetical protein
VVANARARLTKYNYATCDHRGLMVRSAAPFLMVLGLIAFLLSGSLGVLQLHLPPALRTILSTMAFSATSSRLHTKLR